MLSGYGLAGCVDGGRLQGQRRHCQLYSVLRDWFTATELPQIPVQESNHSWSCVYFIPRVQDHQSVSDSLDVRNLSCSQFRLVLPHCPPPALIQEHSFSSYVMFEASQSNNSC